MSVKSIIFDNKKIEIKDFYKNKKLFKIDDIDVDKILVSKKEYGTIKSFNISLDIVMMTLTHYVLSFLK